MEIFGEYHLISMIDSHAHISDKQFDSDREAVIRRALEADVSKMITIGTDITESRSAVALAEHYEHIFATVAVHPEEYSKLPNEEMRKKWKNEIARLAEHSKVVAIGECGLDYHAFGGVPVTEEQKEIQKSGFRDHLDIATHVGKPVVIHARESYGDVSRMVRECIDDIPFFILHCYQGDAEATKTFLELSDRIFFSFAGNITYPVKKVLVGTKDDIRESITLIPIERILTETDCPYLAPQAFRGMRNEPAYVTEVARKIAEVKNISFEDVERATEGNAEKCFPKMV